MMSLWIIQVVPKPNVQVSLQRKAVVWGGDSLEVELGLTPPLQGWVQFLVRGTEILDAVQHGQK